MRSIPFDLCEFIEDERQSELFRRAEEPEGRLGLKDVLNFAIRDELDVLERSVIMLYWFDGVPAKAAADRLGLTTRTFYKALERAMRKLGAALKYAVLLERG